MSYLLEILWDYLLFEAVMVDRKSSTVRMLDPDRKTGADGEIAVTEVSIPTEGCPAKVLARVLHLPLENIRAVEVNHQTYSLDHLIEPGDLVAFVPAARAANRLQRTQPSARMSNNS